jgi:hypothetical protein
MLMADCSETKHANAIWTIQGWSFLHQCCIDKDVAAVDNVAPTNDVMQRMQKNLDDIALSLY